jgi:hypothetical protein
MAPFQVLRCFEIPSEQQLGIGKLRGHHQKQHRFGCISYLKKTEPLHCNSILVQFLIASSMSLYQKHTPFPSIVTESVFGCRTPSSKSLMFCSGTVIHLSKKLNRSCKIIHRARTGQLASCHIAAADFASIFLFVAVNQALLLQRQKQLHILFQGNLIENLLLFLLLLLHHRLKLK